MVHRIVSGRGHIAGIALLIASLTLSACQFGGGAVPDVEVTPVGADTGGIATPRAAATTVAGQAVTPTAAAQETDETGATPRATPRATVAVSPAEVALGGVVLTVAIQPAAPVYDPARVAAAGGDDQKKNPQPTGYAVLGGMALKVTNNFDASQSPPADQSREVLRHVALQIKDKASSQLIPHVNVSIDLLRDGRPVWQDQPLVPMLQAGQGVSQMQYGNNVKFPGRGEYQIFVRLEPSPLLGDGAAGVAQFNVSIK